MDILLELSGGVGRGQENQEDDVYATDNALREIGAYQPPPEYANEPQRYPTEPMVNALEKLQEQNGLKIDGYARPGGPTEQAINNKLLRKPRGAGLLSDFDMSLGDTVGNGFKNEPRDVQVVKRALGGLGYVPEDPFDKPSGFIEESTTNAIKRFQENKRLASDGWMAPGGETEAALQEAVDQLGRAKRAEWLEYRRRAPSPDALTGIGLLDNPTEAVRFVAQLFKNSPKNPLGDLLERGEPGLQLARTEPDTSATPKPAPHAPIEPRNEGIGSPSFDPNYNFGNWPLKRSDVLPEGVKPPTDPLKSDTLPRDSSGEMPLYDDEGRMPPLDVGIDRKREVRWLISRLYRVGAQDESGRHKLSDQDFDGYLDAVKQHIKPEHYAVFELTARAVRAGALDWHTAATRLAAYYAPESTGEAVVDFVLDLVPIVGQVKAAKELHTAVENALDAAAYGDARAHDEALTAAAVAMAALIMPGATGRALKTIAKGLKQELHHLVPLYLGGVKDGPRLALPRVQHQAAADSIHSKMREFFREYDRGLISSWVNPGSRIIQRYTLQERIDALNAFYRSLEKSQILHHREAFDAWQKIFPEVQKYIR